jgi:hypothetical protein
MIHSTGYCSPSSRAYIRLVQLQLTEPEGLEVGKPLSAIWLGLSDTTVLVIP